MDMIEILLIDDNPGDVRLIIEAFKEGKIVNHMSTVGDGVEAIAYLKREAPYVDSVRPDLILLDLNMPRMDGREFLAWIKNEEIFKSIPVIVLTVSKDEQDICQAYNDYANCFITKPVEFATLLDVVKSIEDFWFSIVKLPKSLIKEQK